MTAALDGGEWSAARPSRTLLPVKTRCSFYRRLGGPQGRSGQVRKISFQPGFDPGPSSSYSVAIPTELPGPQNFTYIIPVIRHLTENLDPIKRLDLPLIICLLRNIVYGHQTKCNFYNFSRFSMPLFLIRKLGQWQTTPKNLPRMQCARATPVT